MHALTSPSSLGVFLEAHNETLANNGFKRSSKKLSSTPFAVASSSSSSLPGSYNYIPKSKPFNSSFLDKALKDPPLVQKAENWIADYCTTLEGDECYSCWKAYFELKELEEEEPKEYVESMIVNTGGMKSLINRVHQVSANQRAAKGEQNSMEYAALSKRAEEELLKKVPEHVPDGIPLRAAKGEQNSMESADWSKGAEEKLLKKVPEHVPDGIPMPGDQDMEDAEDMSQHMRLLKAMHVYPSWHISAPRYCMD